MKHNTKKVQKVPDHSIFPHAFIVAVILSYVTSSLYTISLFSSLYGAQPQFSQFTVMMIVSVVVPVVLFSIAFMALSRVPQRLYVTLQLTLMACVVMAAVKAVMLLFPPSLVFLNEWVFYFQYEVVPLVVGLVVFGLLLSRRQKLTRGLVTKALAVSVIALYVSNAGQTAFMILQQLPYNTNLSGFWLSSLATIVAPLLIFAVAFAVNKGRGSKQRIIGSTLVTTVVALSILTVTSMVWIGYSLVLPKEAINSEVLPQGEFAIVALIIMLALLIIHRRRS